MWNLYAHPPKQLISTPFFLVGNLTLFSILGLAAAPGMCFNQAEGHRVAHINPTLFWF